MDNPCLERDKLKDEFLKATIKYVAKVEDTKEEACFGLPNAFRTAQAQESEAYDQYKKTIHRLFEHRKEHGC